MTGTINKNTVCIYDGPSLGDGGHIVVLLSGLTTPSNNTKTGDMVQTYILRADMAPDVAASIPRLPGHNWPAYLVDVTRYPVFANGRGQFDGDRAKVAAATDR